jgi:choline dehydrogenase-like flavoprotein
LPGHSALGVTAKVNTGLSNIVTRSARLDPRWKLEPDPNNGRGVKRIDPAHSTAVDDDNALWIDRARVFQTEMSALTSDYGTVDSSINDIDPEPGPSAGALGARSIGLSHPLGGCRLAARASDGVVDEYGRVFDTAKASEPRPFHEGLYITDATRIPTALGVNPSLTISALALRTVDKIIEELPPVPPT